MVVVYMVVTLVVVYMVVTLVVVYMVETLVVVYQPPPLSLSASCNVSPQEPCDRKAFSWKPWQ